MITDYTPGEFLTYEEYELVFDDTLSANHITSRL